MNKKYGLLETYDGDELGSITLRLIQYYEEDIGVLYEIRFKTEGGVPVLKEMPIRYPTL
jgi:hypothetical protein